MGLLDEADRDFYEKMREALEHGYSDFYEEYLFGWMSEEMTRANRTFVADILDVYASLRRSYEELNDKGGIEERRLAFPGFDGNNEGKYMAYAKFLREKEDRFDYVELGFDGLNSHAPLAGKYESMIEEWKKVPEDRRAAELTKGEILSILDA